MLISNFCQKKIVSGRPEEQAGKKLKEGGDDVENNDEKKVAPMVQVRSTQEVDQVLSRLDLREETVQKTSGDETLEASRTLETIMRSNNVFH